jgi:hypothetical protein
MMGEGFPPLAEIVRPHLAPKTFAVGAILAARVPTNMVVLVSVAATQGRVVRAQIVTPDWRFGEEPKRSYLYWVRPLLVPS